MEIQTKKKIFASSIAVVIMLSGCSTWHKLDNTEKGAVIGGGTGALIGDAVAPGVGGTVVGGALGAVGGGLIGQEEDRHEEEHHRHHRY